MILRYSHNFYVKEFHPKFILIILPHSKYAPDGAAVLLDSSTILHRHDEIEEKILGGKKKIQIIYIRI